MYLKTNLFSDMLLSIEYAVYILNFIFRKKEAFHQKCSRIKMVLGSHITHNQLKEQYRTQL